MTTTIKTAVDLSSDSLFQHCMKVCQCSVHWYCTWCNNTVLYVHEKHCHAHIVCLRFNIMCNETDTVHMHSSVFCFLTLKRDRSSQNWNPYIFHIPVDLFIYLDYFVNCSILEVLAVQMSVFSKISWIIMSGKRHCCWVCPMYFSSKLPHYSVFERRDRHL